MIDLEAIAEQFGTPLYVYDAQKIRSQYQKLASNFNRHFHKTPTNSASAEFHHTSDKLQSSNNTNYSTDCEFSPLQQNCTKSESSESCKNALKARFFYAMKANFNPHILKILLEEDCGVDTVSVNEVKLALRIGFKPENIIFTPANCSNEEMAFALEKGINLNLGSLSELKRLGQNFPGSEISVRVNPDVGAGAHSHIITGGPLSKFGISYQESDKIKEIIEKYDLSLVGIHSHIGSGILDADKFLEAMEVVLSVAKDFENLRFVDFGGGFGVPYQSTESPLDLEKLGEEATNKFEKFRGFKDIEMFFEPGKFLLAEAGVLLVRVNTTKTTPEGRKFACVNSGFNHLIRPTMYNAYHEIINISNPEGEKTLTDISGNICESGDLFARDREIAKANEGDILAILNAGAYGMSMASNYNLQSLPAEVLVDGQGVHLIRKRQDFEEIVKGFEF